MRMRRSSKSPADDVSATSSSSTVRSPSRASYGGLQRVEPGPGYDEDAALQAALEASAREHAARTGHPSVPSSLGAGAQYPAPDQEERELQQALELSKRTGDEQLAYELQQQEVQRSQAASASQTSSTQPADPFAALAGLTAQSPSALAPSQPKAQQRSSNNPFAPNRRMPWDVRPAIGAVSGGTTGTPAGNQGTGSISGSMRDPFAALPPLFAPPSEVGRPSSQPLSQPPAQRPAHTLSAQYPQYPPAQPYRPPGVPQPPQQPVHGSGWQATFPEPLANGPAQSRTSARLQHLPSVTDDEALARALQRQLDMEAPPAPQPDSRDEALAKALQEQLNREAQPTPSVWPGSRQSNSAQAPPPPQPVLDASLCGGCGRPALGGWGTYISALGRSWHQGCFCCGHCKLPMAESFVTEPSGHVPFHAECYRLAFGQRCCVCADIIPEVPGRGIMYMTHDFWKDQKSCPAHQNDGTARCTACQRLCPRAEHWAQLEEGRHICLACLDSVVVDTQDAQPLYAKIMAFFESMGMKLPVKPPLMLVDSTALNSAEATEHRPTAGGGGGRRDGGGPVFHTRGLTLTQEYRHITTVVRNRGVGTGLPFFSIRPETTRIEGPAHTEVTAILVQYGLPWLLTGSILAHELMHAYLRLAGLTQLSLDVEEGLCQLMALLWLEHQTPAPEGTWEERLASYFAHQIRTDRSHVYGDGFRAAHEAFQKYGLGATLASVRTHGRLPLD